MNEYLNQFCISCKHIYQKEIFGKEYCRLTGKWVLDCQEKCDKWESKW